MEFNHYSVLLNECIEGLNINPNGIYVDGTAGGAGHSSEIAKRIKEGKLIALDQDPDAIKIASQRLNRYTCSKVVKSNFSEMNNILKKLNIDGVDGVLLDLGISSYQIDTAHRGFSYRMDSDLDMRMSQNGVSAKDIVNTYSFGELADIIRIYGEEKYYKSIARNIVKFREKKKIETTFDLVLIIKSSMPESAKRDKNPCKKTFQAIRIEVNKELDHLKLGIENAFNCLNPKGRLVIITFHSLEDRLVKKTFNEFCKGCTCPSDFPICVCNNNPSAKLINKKPILPNEKELNENNRSHSAKLRILEKI